MAKSKEKNCSCGEIILYDGEKSYAVDGAKHTPKECTPSYQERQTRAIEAMVEHFKVIADDIKGFED